MTFIPPHGDYEQLLSYQKAEVVYDITNRFCQRLERDFVKEGGLRERMTKARLQYRNHERNGKKR
jgi:four helix bundle suffix protein